jgi:5-methylcytosine-specific restriction protein B
VFRRKGTNTWVTNDESNNAKDISVEDAVVIARTHRDQLLTGVELIKRLPANGNDDDYHRLQERLGQDAPAVSDLMWGHKYFHLIFPDKLDHLHIPEYQRFYLLKLLQRPPDSKGRYVCAGRFVAAASEMGVPMNNLMELFYSANGSPHGYWRVGTSDGKVSRNRWAMMRDGNFVAIGWPAVGDLSNLEKDKESREKLQRLVTEKYPTTPQGIGKARSQILNFVLGIREGDAVLAADGGTILGIGRVTGPYSHDPNSDFPHRRPVQWISLEEWKMPEPEGLQTTVHEVRKHIDNILEVEMKTQGAASSSAAAPTVKPPTIAKPGSRPQWPRLEGIPGRIQAVLERKSQLIIYGPPGTGKTFWAQTTTLDLAAHWTFGKSLKCAPGAGPVALPLLGRARSFSHASSASVLSC